MCTATYLFHRHFHPYTALFHPVRLLKFKQFDHDFLILGKDTLKILQSTFLVKNINIS